MSSLNNKKIRTLIADDEPAARASIEILLQSEPDIDVIGSCGDGLTTLKVIESLKPDLVFLDVQMPELTGFEVLEALGADALPAIVFVTAFDQYALKAFDNSAVDYLLKPYDDERFYQSLRKARRQLARAEVEATSMNFAHLLEILKSTTPRSSYLQRLTVKNSGRISFIPVDNIIFIESEGNFVKINMAGGIKAGNYTFKQLETMLDPNKFLRIHKSFIVNLDYIEIIEPYFHGDYTVILNNGTKLKLSRNYKASLDRIMGGE